ncbi:PP2C family protein-serine/threonine phosphatase [Candidatus Puniceispirillum marinum]|uniref:Serine phosphatase RsbU n=1 Tax=Puniceispirillum marinum (strain IMCC1322) TaxID=488538 RepID=D5BQQ4_PUNMI|nr:GAF domain-containing SpoIIE family protein phosphatase [Candidatus Puniceispirillum marinum]ADE40772.1 Serine phosphatase RsbU [Candidatus Puniceispirillum marinum IMCC1322]
MAVPASSMTSVIDGNITLMNGMVQRYAETGDYLEGLRWAIPHILDNLSAEAISLFLHRPDESVLECVICDGPVNVTGLKVPQGLGLVGRVFHEGKSDLVPDATIDDRHFTKVDKQSGFKTLSTATVPVRFGAKSYGVIQAINRRHNHHIQHFRQSDLSLLESLAGALALAISNFRLAEQVTKDALLRRDLGQAQEAQALLMPEPEQGGYAAGQTLTSRQLSGDFFDYFMVGNRLAFCQGDVAGKGIASSLLMARCIALFRYLARQNFSVETIVIAMNDEFINQPSGQFITFVMGWLDCTTHELNMMNCGHTPVVWVKPDGTIITIDAQVAPLGVISFTDQDLHPAQITLDCGYLYLATDGITEARNRGLELGMSRFVTLVKNLKGRDVSAKLNGVMQLFAKGNLVTHDDATLLVISSGAYDG